MLTTLTTELTGVLLILERYQVVDHFTLSIAVSRHPLAPAIASLLASLLSAIEDCHERLKALALERSIRNPQIPPSFMSPEPFDPQNVLHQRFERQDWLPNDDYPMEKCDKSTDDIVAQCVEPMAPISYSGASSPECFEALNLSVAASPEAMNLSLATSPCYNMEDHHSRSSREVGPSNVFWDHVSLDVKRSELEAPSDCFGSENIPVHPSEGLKLDFESTSALGDNYILDITNNVVADSDPLNEEMYFELPRDPPDLTPRAPDPVGALYEFPISTTALDLSHPSQPVQDSFLPHHDLNVRLQNECVEQPNAINESESFTCNVCQKVLKSMRSLKRHEDAHKEGQMVCDYCGKSFHLQWLLRRHVLAHISGHVCKTCGVRCSDERKLRRHEASIHASRQHFCTLCKKKFNRGDGLKRHMEITHFKSKEFKCIFCKKRFSVKCNLTTHMDNIHGGGVEVQCDVCGQRCKNKATFRAHSKTHRPPVEVCQPCNRQFFRKSYYRRHMKNHHGIT